MYTLEELQSKTFKELKEIGWQLNVLPSGDRRQKQTWIDALVGAKLPLIELLEVSPGVEVDQAQETKTNQSIFSVAQIENFTFLELLDFCRVTLDSLPVKTLKQIQQIRVHLLDLNRRTDRSDPRGHKCHRSTWISAVVRELRFAVQIGSMARIPRGLGYIKESLWDRSVVLGGFDDFRSLLEVLVAEVAAPKPIAQTAKDSPGVEVESVAEPIEVQAQEPHASKFGRIVYPKLAAEPIAQAAETSPGVENFTEADQPPNRGDNGRGRLETEAEMLESAIAQATKNSPGVSRKTSTAHQLLELFKSSAHIIEDSPAETEAEILESAIELSTENFLDAEADDRNPILTGVTFSDSFLARYSPPQSENIHYQAGANGQLSLLDFEVESVDEPPDPDDFEGDMFAFWAAYDTWCERTDDDSEQFEPLEISLTSMCEWAPCPLEWYEPKIIETIETIETVSCTLELSPVSVESSSTCNFSIPTFDAWCDRPIDKDEPPDTGVFARLPKPKPPSFPPMSVVAGDGVPPRKLRTNGKKFARSAILLSGRAPPGGDAM